MSDCFSGSSIKFQGHTGWKIDDLNPIWVRLLGWSQLSNPSDLHCFQLGTYSVDLYDSRWIVSPRIHSTSLIKIQMKILSNAFKIILLKDHFLRTYDLGSVNFIIMNCISLRVFNILVHLIFMIGQTAACWDQINKQNHSSCEHHQ